MVHDVVPLSLAYSMFSLAKQQRLAIVDDVFPPKLSN